MSQVKKAPAYNLKVVLQMTGIKPDTLRAWERRYGLPLPQRTAGGHRLYSQYDIEMIKWLMDRQVEGMRINRAIDLWRDIEADGKDPLDQSHPVGRAEPIVEMPTITGSSLDVMRNNWIQACLAFDEGGAERILSQSFALYPVEMVCIEVMQKGIVNIGEWWYRGEVTVQQEHFASGLILRRLDSLIAASPSPSRHDKILIGCPSEEEHVMAALVTTLFLRRQGWDVVYLGADVPLIDLEQAVIQTSAKLVILIASQLHTAANLFTTAHSLTNSGIRVAFAGSIFSRQSGLIQSIPGVYLGDRLDKVVQEVQTVLDFSLPAVLVLPTSRQYEQAKHQLEDRQAAIKADVWNEFSLKGITEQTLRIANDTFMRDILSALTLNSLESLEMEIDWVRMMMEHQSLPKTLLPEYMGVFAAAIDRQVGESAKVVSDWLRESASRQEWRG